MNSDALATTILATVCVAGAIGAILYAAVAGQGTRQAASASARGRRVVSVVEEPQAVEELAIVVSDNDSVEESAQEQAEPEEDPRISNLPFVPNPRLAIRESLRDNIRSTLLSRGAVSLVNAAESSGGVGKTLLAVDYIQRYIADYKVVWWIRASRPSTLASDFAALATALDLKMEGAAQCDVREAVVNVLSRSAEWLLVFDDATDPAILEPYLPRTGAGHVIITSQSSNWWKYSVPISIKGFDRMESIELLFDRTGETNGAIVTQLAALLHDLPLALDHCSTYISRSGSSASDYLSRFRIKKTEVATHIAETMDTHEMVAVVVSLSVEEACREASSSEALLNTLAFCSSEAISIKLFEDNIECLPEFSSLTRTPDALRTALAVLQRNALVDVCDEWLFMHGMVQSSIRERLGVEARRQWAGVAVRLNQAAFDFDGRQHSAHTRCSTLLPHALVAASHAEELEVESEVCATLLDEIAIYLRACGEYEESKHIGCRALAIAEAAYGSMHPKVAVCADTLGATLYLMRDFSGARSQYEHALNVDETAYGEQHPCVATRLSNLGRALCGLGLVDPARDCLERALQIAEATYGGRHANVASRAADLAHVLEVAGELEGARELLERALNIEETAYGLTHPGVAERAHRLGVVLIKLGDIDQARPYFDRALKIESSTYGHGHPRVAARLANLGEIYEHTGDPEYARDCYEEALAIDEAIYGQMHPRLLGRIEALGRMLEKMGDYEAARERYMQVLSVEEAMHGPEHPRVAEQAIRLGSICRALGDLLGAQSQFERAMEICQAAYGPAHPEVANVLVRLADVINELGDSKTAKMQLGRALRIRQEQLGLAHPDTESVRRSITLLAA